MSIPPNSIEDFLAKRNECFMQADLDAYLDLWAEEGTLEMNAFVCNGRAKIGETITFAWSMLECLHMETRAFAVNGGSILNEFSIVWKNKKTDEITLQTGMGVIETNAEGKMTYLRDYFDSNDGRRASALESSRVEQLLSS